MNSLLHSSSWVPTTQFIPGSTLSIIILTTRKMTVQHCFCVKWLSTGSRIWRVERSLLEQKLPWYMLYVFFVVHTACTIKRVRWCHNGCNVLRYHINIINRKFVTNKRTGWPKITTLIQLKCYGYCQEVILNFYYKYICMNKHFISKQ